MRGVRRALVASMLVLTVSNVTFAGDLTESLAKAAADLQTTQGESHPIDKAYLWPGAALFVAGMTMTLYGWLHTSGGQFTSGQVSTESKTEMGGAGLAVAGLGGAILFFGSQKAKHSTGVSITPGRVAVAKRISW
jgi:hypothetical protein